MPKGKGLPKNFKLPSDAPDDLVIEDDDFLEHWDFTDDDMDLDEEVQQLRVLFPDGDAGSEEEWRELFRSERRLIDDAPRTAAAYGAIAGYSGSGRDLGMADRLRAYGLKVVEVAGWQTRGSSEFHPRGSIDHHTAGGLSGNAPSLGICTNGRSDLPGPLCHVLIGRDNTCYVIASGRANHAGTGSYAGVTGNSNVYGVEHENTGTGSEPWREDQRVTAAKVHAALLNWKRNGFVCQHKEWAPTRKIDKWDQTGSDMRTRTTGAWNQYDNPQQAEVLHMFKSGTDYRNVVRTAYQNITGRDPETQQVVDAWAWTIAAEQGSGYHNLVTALHYERRLKEDAKFQSLVDRITAAEGKLSKISTTVTLSPEVEQQILSKVYADLAVRIQ
jgi:hypothetical protein